MERLNMSEAERMQARLELEQLGFSLELHRGGLGGEGLVSTSAEILFMMHRNFFLTITWCERMRSIVYLKIICLFIHSSRTSKKGYIVSSRPPPQKKDSGALPIRGGNGRHPSGQ